MCDRNPFMGIMGSQTVKCLALLCFTDLRGLQKQSGKERLFIEKEQETIEERDCRIFRNGNEHLITKSDVLDDLKQIVIKKKQGGRCLKAAIILTLLFFCLCWDKNKRLSQEIVW